MKRILLFFVLLSCTTLAFSQESIVEEDIKTQSSASLVINAWQGFNSRHYDDAIQYADECLRRFADKASRMQSQLSDYPVGSNDQIHAYYALNDVATALYIKGESLRKMDKTEQARQAFEELVNQYSFGQCWDPRGWFWKPAIVAREKLHMMETNQYYDFGDYSSRELMVLAWKALDEGDPEAVMAYTNKCLELYKAQADEMQKGLEMIPVGSEDEIHAYWALNDVATAYFIQGEAFFKSDQLDQAKAVYQKVIDEYPFAQCWDPRGWFWTVADGAREKIEMIDSGLFMDFWDYTSKDLIGKAWSAMKDGDQARAKGYAQKCIQLYSDDAVAMQKSLETYVSGSDEEKHAYWALNDVATAHYIIGRVLFDEKRFEEARQAFQRVVDQFSYGQCWDPKGWWWKPAQEAEKMLKTIHREEWNAQP